MSLRQRTFRPDTVDARGLQPALDRAHHQVRRVQRNLAGALALDLDRETGFGCLDDDFVVQAQRQAQAVEAGTEVGAGRRHDGGGRQPGRQRPRHRSPPR